jgi:hypothetical protein
LKTKELSDYSFFVLDIGHYICFIPYLRRTAAGEDLMTSQAQTVEVPPAEAPAPEDAPDVPTPRTGPVARNDREAMLAEQMAACHQVVLDCLARAGRAGDAEAPRHGELRLAARFMSLFLRQSGALDRHGDHVRRTRETEEKAGRDSLNRQVTLATAQGRGLAQGFEDSLRRFEQAEREAGAPPDDLAAPAQPGADAATTAQPGTDPAEGALYPRGDDFEAWAKIFAAPPRRAEVPPAAAAPPPKLTRQQRRAADRAERRARSKAGKAGMEVAKTG